MNEIIFNCYKKFRKENKESLFKSIFKLPKLPIILLTINIATSIVYLIGIFVFNNVGIVSVCLIIEVVICIILYFYTEHYNVKISRIKMNEFIEYYSNVALWLESIGIKITKENITIIKEQFEEKIKKLEERQKNKNDKNERWIQVLFIPIILAVFTILLERQTEIVEIMKYAIKLLMFLGLILFTVYPFYQYKDFFKKRKIEQMQNLVDDLQGVLYTQTENKIISKIEYSSDSVEKVNQKLKCKTQRKLLSEFPEIGCSKIKELDVNIKAKIMSYKDATIRTDISEYMQDEIKKCVGDKNKDLEDKCLKLATLYLENERKWRMQEGWYSILSFTFALITMVLGVSKINNPIVNAILALVFLVFSLGMNFMLSKNKKMYGKKIESFMNSFNNHTSSIAFLTTLIIYLTTQFEVNLFYELLTIVPLFVIGILSTILWYKRQEKVNKKEKD